MITNKVANDITKQLDWANTYPQFTSRHEAYGVLAEEFYELMKGLHENNHDNFYLELSQIAAVCIKEMTRLNNK